MTDNTTTNAFKTLLSAAIGLLVLVALLLLASRLWPLSGIQKASLAALQPQPQDNPGRNAYAALATLSLDGLTSEQRQARVDAFVPRYVQWQAAFQARSSKNIKTLQPPPSLLARNELERPFDTRLCSFQEAPHCLNKLLKQPVTDILVAHRDLLTRVAALSNDGHVQQPAALRPGLGAPMPRIQLLATPLAAHAQAYLNGDPQAALTGLCQDASTGRMLMMHGDNLLLAAGGGAMLTANAQLLGSMLAEMPAITPLPAACQTALAPLTATEMSTCTAMRGEFAMVSANFPGNLRSDFNKAGMQLFFNAEKTAARTAESMGFPCLPDNLPRIAKDQMLTPPPSPAMLRLECVTNYVGCVLTSIAAPAYRDYVARQLDAGAQLRLLNAALWLRDHPAADPKQPLIARLQALPASLRDSPRQLRVSSDGRALELPVYYQGGKNQTLSMPLPASALSR